MTAWKQVTSCPVTCATSLMDGRTVPLSFTPQLGAADAEIKVPSGENMELKRSPFEVWSRSVYSHACYTHC